MRLSTTLCLLLLLSLASGAQAQWKWKDSSGNVQYSDRPPPIGTPEKDILQKPPQRFQPVVVRPVGASAPQAAAEAASTASAPRPDPQAQARQRQQEQDQAAKQKDDERKQALQRAENCKNARGQLQMLESGVRVKRNNDQGEPVVLDDKQRNDEMQRARTIIASECR